MRIRTTAVWMLALICLSPSTISAQWPHCPTAGVPKRPNRKPDLGAAALRTADGKPDLSGIGIDPDVILDPACSGQPGNCISQEPLPIRAANIGFSSRDQLARAMRGENTPNLLPYRPWAADLVSKRVAFSATGVGGASRRLGKR